jgi:hypothetical protein
VALTPEAGLAVTFTQTAPATCPATTEVTFDYNLSNLGTGEWMVPGDPNASGHYISNVDYTIGVYANSRVNQIGVRVDSFRTESGFDFLDFKTNETTIHLTGAPATGWRDIHAFVPSNPIGNVSPKMRFVSDFNVTDTGIAIGKARVCTDNPAVSPPQVAFPIAPVTRYNGVLLGTNDVVFFTASVGSTKAGDACSSAHDTFALWGDSTVGNDFDLYVRCNALPTPDNWTFKGFSSDTQEFVHADNGTCPCGGTWFIAVSSFSGSGWFNLVQQKHYANKHQHTASVVAQDNWVNLQASLQPRITVGFRHFFGANEGARYWDQYTLEDTKTSGDIRIYPSTMPGQRANADVCGEGCTLGPCGINMYSHEDDGRILSHEMGHHYNCLHDEYADNVGTHCGHNIMGNQFFTNTNYCWCNQVQSGTHRCSMGFGDHGWDPTPISLMPVYDTVWTYLNQFTPAVVTSTPDNFDFTTFDFNGLYAVPVITDH